MTTRFHSGSASAGEVTEGLPSGAGLIVRGSAWLLASIGTWAVSSFVFWLIAARLAAPSSVGRAAALSSSVLAVVLVTSSGMPIALSRFTHDRDDDPGGLFSWALFATGTLSVVGAVAFFLLAPESVTSPLTAHGNLTGMALFAATVVGTAFSTLTDVRLTIHRRWGWVLVRVVVVNCVRIPLIFMAPGGDEAFMLFLLATAVPAVSGLLGVAALQAARLGGRRLWPVPVALRPAARYAGVNHLATLGLQAPLLALPLIVVFNVEPSVNAAFYIAWGVTAVVFLVPQTIGQVLLVEGGREGATFLHQLRVSLALAFGLAASATVGVFLFNDVFVSVYGQAYETSARLLPPLVGASVAWAVTCIALADARVRKSTRDVLFVAVTFAVTVLVPAAVVTPSEGVDGTVRAWLAANAVTAAVALMVLLRSHGWRSFLPARASRETGVALSGPVPAQVTPDLASQPLPHLIGERRAV
jgi:O-antigen/teichoic acid export membrane protein